MLGKWKEVAEEEDRTRNGVKGQLKFCEAKYAQIVFKLNDLNFL